MREASAERRSYRILPFAIRSCIFLLVLGGIYFFTDVLYEQAGALMQSFEAGWGIWALLLFTAVYSLLLAIPFVPGMELGLAIMMVFGWRSVPLVFAASLGAFSLSYLVGGKFPARVLQKFLELLHLNRANQFVSDMLRLSPPERLERLISPAAGKMQSFLARHRYLALIVVLNIPGNALIGGGWGIGLLAGLSGFYSYHRYALAVALAISPAHVVILAGQLLG